MTFAYSGGVITQSGTDTDLSGLSGLTGVTTVTSDPDTAAWGQDIYIIDASTRMDVTGTLTIEPDNEMLIMEGAATNNITSNPLRVTGTLNLGVQKTGNGNISYSNAVGINFTDKGQNPFAYFSFYVSGTLVWNGGIIRSAATIRFENNATITINKGVFLEAGNGTSQIRLTPTSTAGGANLNLNDVVIDGLDLGGKFFTTRGFGNASFTLKNGYIQQYNGDYPEQIYSNLKNNENIAAQDFEFSNATATRGGNIIFNGVEKRLIYSLSNRYGYVKTFRQTNLSPVDLLGAGVTYSFYGKDINNGNRTIGPNDGGTDIDGLTVDQDDTADIVYTGLNQTGAYADDILIETLANFAGVGTADDRTSSDTIPIKFIGYNESISTWSSNLIGIGTLTENVIMTPDLSISQSTRATVDAYTELETPEKFYDRTKSYLCDNFSTYQDFLVTRSGSTIDAGSYNIDVDASAGSVFAFDGSKITIKATEFTGNITTTGTITLLNGAKIIGTATDAGGATTTLQYSITGLVAGSNVQIYNETTASEVYIGIVAGTSLSGTYTEGVEFTAGNTISVNTANTSGLTAYTETTATVIASSTGWSALISQPLCPIYNANGIDGSTVTGITLDVPNVEFDLDETDNSISSQEIYAWYKNELMTADGLRTIYKAIIPNSQYRYSIDPSIVDLKFENKDLVNSLAITGGYFYRTDNTSVIAAGSGNIEMIPNESYVANSDSIQSVLNQFTFSSGYVETNVKAVSDSTESADNLELQYNGTGLTGVAFPATQGQVSNISITGSAVNAISESYVLTTGSLSSGTYDDTHALDGVKHVHNDTGGVLDLYYQFDIGATGIPTGVKVVGAITGNNDQIGVYAYNWITTDWNQVGTMIGTSSSDNSTFSYDLLTAHVGTGANVGTTRIRFYQPSGLTSATLYIDQLLVSETINPTGIANGSTVTLTEDVSNTNLIGNGWKLNLNNQIISGTYVKGAVAIVGAAISDNDNPFVFEDCVVRGATLSARGIMLRSGLTEETSLILTSTTGVEDDLISFADCVSGVAGTDVPSIDASGVTKTTSINFRRWSGGLKIIVNAFCTASVDVVSGGSIQIHGTGGIVAVRGICNVVDNSGGAVTIVQDSVLNKENIADSSRNIIHQDHAQGPGSGTAQIQLSTTASSVDGAYDPSMIHILEGTGAGQSRIILEYNGTTKIAAVDRSWKVAPDATSHYVVEAGVNMNSINEGILQSGGANTATLNVLASSDDDAYVGQLLWLRGSTGEDQACLIIGYNGTTKVATLERPWGTQPDNTTSYMVMPASPVLLGQVTHTGATIPNVTTVDTTTNLTTNNDKTGYSISGTKTTLDALNDLSEAQVNSQVDIALTDYDAPTKAELDLAVAPLATEANATSNTSSIVSEINANEAKIDVVDANVDAILVDTGTTIPAQINNLNDLSGSEVWSFANRELTSGTRDSEIDQIKIKTDQMNFTGSDIQSTASNMRGTDGAVTPANLGPFY